MASTNRERRNTDLTMGGQRNSISFGQTLNKDPRATVSGGNPSNIFGKNEIKQGGLQQNGSQASYTELIRKMDNIDAISVGSKQQSVMSGYSQMSKASKNAQKIFRNLQAHNAKFLNNPSSLDPQKRASGSKYTQSPGVKPTSKFLNTNRSGTANANSISPGSFIQQKEIKSSLLKESDDFNPFRANFDIKSKLRLPVGGKIPQNNDASPQLEYGAHVNIEDMDESKQSETTMAKEDQSELVALKFKFTQQRRMNGHLENECSRLR